MAEILKAAPDLAPRQEVVDVPELGGAVIVRGLMASEAFALGSLRGQALRRAREVVAAARREYDERCKTLKPGAEPPPFEPPEVDLSFDELQQFGRYVPLLLQHAVVLENGLAFYTAAQWEVAHQHHPAAVARLTAIAERLSGLDREDVEKNSPVRRS